MSENVRDDADMDDLVEDEFDHSAESDEVWYGDGEDSSRRSKSLQLTCFSCNRCDYHYLAYRKKWFYSYLTGLTFGIAKILGPFRCKCCGHQRFLRYDWMHPKKWIMDKKRRQKSARR